MTSSSWLFGLNRALCYAMITTGSMPCSMHCIKRVLLLPSLAGTKTILPVSNLATMNAKIGLSARMLIPWGDQWKMLWHFLDNGELVKLIWWFLIKALLARQPWTIWHFWRNWLLAQEMLAKWHQTSFCLGAGVVCFQGSAGRKNAVCLSGKFIANSLVIERFGHWQLTL